jgi:hydrogenase maturation protein HypF
VSDVVRTGIRVEGVVQGVGFRPFVYSLATSLGLGGLVGNDPGGVFAEVEGSPEAVAKFLALLELQAPPLARIERVAATSLGVTGGADFVIMPSQAGGQHGTLIAADSATCAECLRELADPADRRYRYPFLNCTNCGPRFTIVRDVPYDRPSTTMSGFPMCAQCAAEYHDPANRRFHAQPVCCPACGPRLALVTADGASLPGSDPLVAAADLLRSGQIVAVKGLGGYHFTAAAGNEHATAALRARKHREDKPFALMVPDLATAGLLCAVDEIAERLLASARRPIVLMPRLPAADRQVAAAVAPGNRELGVMLPYTPLHHLLLEEVAGPIVATSGNVSDEPIAVRDDEALERLAGIADAFLLHDRPIHIRTDDSVVRVLAGRESVIRRSRGYVPEPLTVSLSFRRPVLACGAELKNTFCLAKGNRAFVSQHIGDLGNAVTLRSFTEGVEHFRRVFEVEPKLVAHDLHPDYLSTKYAVGLAGVELLGVQHHHAHVAACLADNGEAGPVIGVAFDGTGYGTDGTIWGGEFLIADLAGFERAAYLDPVPMPGGAAAVRQPWRMAAAYLAASYRDGMPEGLAVCQRNDRLWAAVLAMADRKINSPLTSSAGRLFDAVAALVGVRDEVNYEGQAAIELEQLADVRERSGYPAAITGRDGRLTVRGADLVSAAAQDLLAGVAPPLIAARFHNGVAAAIVGVCALLREQTGLTAVVLSGGVFQNQMLTSRAIAGLAECGFRVMLHSRVPCNDGGISLGQAAVAGALDRLAAD